MNDFSELETELKKLRSRAASPDLAARIERALAEAPSAIPTAGVLPRRSKLNWFALGLGLTAAAAFLLLARVNVERTPAKMQRFTTGTPSTSKEFGFLPAGLTQVVYNTRDEGLHFADGADQPVRRMRSRTRETLRWNNPQTGASLRVSYPTEEVTLIPASGQ